MSWRPAILIAVLGFGAAIGVTVSGEHMGNEASVLLGTAFAGAALTGIVGIFVLRSLRARSLRLQAIAVAVIAVLGTAVGIAASGTAMFVSSHDLEALVVVLLTSGTAAVLVALYLGSRIGSASRDLEGLIEQIGDGDVLTMADRPAAHELRQLAERLEESSARLEESRRRERALESSRRELVAWVSHDLRTPLAGIRAIVEALEDGVVDDPETVARYHRTMRDESDKLAALVDDLFELSRIQAGAVELSIEPVSLGDFVSDAVAGASMSADRKGVALEGRLNDLSAPTVDMSAREMNRVVRNLLDNAIRHTPPGGHVMVEAGEDGPVVYVSVVDNGGGIPEDEISRVFDLAFRGDAARTPGHEGGAGLGLAIARGFVEAHEGEIGVANENGGARFTVRIPRSLDSTR